MAKARSAAQKAATKRMIAANKAKRSGKKPKKARAYAAASNKSGGAKRKKGTVLGYITRKPGKLYYVTKNGALVETGCKNTKKGACRAKSKKAPKGLRRVA